MHTNQPLFGALLETRIKEPNLNRVMSTVCHGWNFTSDHLSDHGGRIVVIWKDPAQIRVLSQSRQTLTYEVKIASSVQFVVTAIYAANTHDERTDHWVELLNLQHTLSLFHSPWVIGGDFNQILHFAEHSSPSTNSIDGPMTMFRDCLLQMGMFDLRSQGPQFTWTNNQPSDPIVEKLDRVLVNSSWISMFPNSTTTFLAPNISDHCPALLDLSYQLPKTGTRPFKFFNYLIQHPNFLPVVKDAWLQAGSNSKDLANLCWKQRVIKRDLKQLNRENFSQIQERVSEANCLLQAVQVQALQSPSTATFQQERDLHIKWNFLSSGSALFSINLSCLVSGSLGLQMPNCPPDNNAPSSYTC
ncbi:unnamed protein product [Arabis nemorensis]|uniref:Endonuclease/exonuclease/phosphatase domain-containing protein n=1 Tax=Arabis nemorensis TaxID=586526 RepID=A0A565C680_9BRAS|nr:unnamed protein product [Arabis nemorensis]